MVTFLTIASSAVVSRMVWPLSAGSKLIVSPPLASASACRNDPGPLSFPFVTVMTFAGADITVAQTSANQIAAHRFKKAD